MRRLQELGKIIFEKQTMISIDGLKVAVIKNLLQITEKNSPYFKMSVLDYMATVAYPNNQKISEMKRKLKMKMEWQKRFNELSLFDINIEIKTNGFLVNDKFFIGATKNRWKNKGTAKWYYFKSIEDLVTNYILKSQSK